MGILFDALSISLGGILGGKFKERVLIKNMMIFGISIMIISIVGFMENIFNISNMELESTNLMVIIFCLIAGSCIGDYFHIHIAEKLSKAAKFKSKSYNVFMESTLFFGIGGLQVSGPILLAVNGDSKQLLLKGIIDFPFALMFGVSYGLTVSLSAIPVAIVQIIIFIAAFFSGSLMNDCLIRQVCSMGYIVLFFSGYNMIYDGNNRINNVNMLPGIILIIIYNTLCNIWRSAV